MNKIVMLIVTALILVVISTAHSEQLEENLDKNYSMHFNLPDQYHVKVVDTKRGFNVFYIGLGEKNEDTLVVFFIPCGDTPLDSNWLIPNCYQNAPGLF
jgi:hypothetical protein